MGNLLNHFMNKKRMQKKAMVVTQLFLIILSIMTVVLILYFGYRAIDGIIQQGRETKIEDFKASIEVQITTLLPKFGSIRQLTFDAPEEIEEICFIDTDRFAYFNSNNIFDDYPLIYDSVSSSSDMNLFIFGKDLERGFNVGGISINITPYYNCYKPLGNKISVTMKSLGGKALIIK